MQRREWGHGLQHFPRPERAFRALVGLEKGEDLTHLFQLLAHGGGHLFALCRRVIRLSAAEVAEICRDHGGRLEVVGFGNVQRCFMPAENVGGFVAKPVFVPKSEGDPQLVRHQR